jgi:3-dehydroquinate dehydratase type I
MKYPYCLPIIKSTKEEVFATIQSHKAEYPYFEVWLDYIEELDTAFLKKLQAELSERLVVVFRRQESAPIKMSMPQRYELLNSLDGSSTLVDLDITTQTAEIDYIQQKGHRLQTIISYHNYQQTPGEDGLQRIMQQIRKKNPTILKIATNCQNEKDSLRLLNLLLLLRETSQKYIILGMGEHGLMTRIFGPLWGNELIFAPEHNEEQSAPGQLTRKQLDNILQTIGE